MDYTLIRHNFEKHGFSTQLFPTKQQAREYLCNTLRHKTIGFGGSETLKEMELFEALQRNNAVVWHNRIPAYDVRRLANCASVYITSANAAAATGELVNIDGTGNRIAMTCFGPDICYHIVGRNKITGSLDDAVHRSKNVAAPKNAKRLGVKTPCALKADRCYDCSSPERICRITAIIDRVPLGMKSEIIFIDEDLGF